MLIQEGDHVRIEKIDTREDPRYDTADWEEYDPGEPNEKSPPVEYEVRGELLEEITEEESILIRRYERNGERIPGTFRTSRVEARFSHDDHNIAITQNSVYKITKVV